MGNCTCPKCSQNINYGVKFCPHCGTPLAWGQVEESDKQKKSSKESKIDEIGQGCVGLLFLIAIGFGIWYCYNKFSESTDTASQPSTTETTPDIMAEFDAYSWAGKTCSFFYNDIKYKFVFEDAKRGTLYVTTDGTNIPLKFSYTSLDHDNIVEVSDSKGILSAMGLNTYLHIADGYVYNSATAAEARDTEQGFKCTISEKK